MIKIPCSNVTLSSCLSFAHRKYRYSMMVLCSVCSLSFLIENIFRVRFILQASICFQVLSFSRGTCANSDSKLFWGFLNFCHLEGKGI
uniref:Uncharacterized protein n=1 Tax=Anguilla anguilla TaxID=7936 RepID=A0A0E9PR25_ANGAN